jgi:hypothetical protein
MTSTSWKAQSPDASPRGVTTVANTPDAKQMLQKFLAARRQECPLCGSTRWESPKIVTVDYKDMGGIYEQVSARSPCGHVMHFSLQMLRGGPTKNNALLSAKRI